MNDEDIDIEQILSTKWVPINGRLSFWGDTFGKPYDNYYTTQKYLYVKNDDLLIILFDECEKLYVWEPKNIKIEFNMFQVKDAKKVRLEWYKYGSKYTEDDIIYYEYIKSNNKVVMYKGGKHLLEMIAKTFIISNEPAVSLY